jgi:hypothetical protein
MTHYPYTRSPYWVPSPPRPPQPPPRRSHAKLIALVAITLAAVGLLVILVVGLHGSGNTSQPAQTQPTTQIIQPTQTQPPRSPAWQEGYYAVINLKAGWQPGWYPHYFTHLTHYSPYTIGRWCDSLSSVPGANQWPALPSLHSSQLKDFEAGLDRCRLRRGGEGIKRVV